MKFSLDKSSYQPGVIHQVGLGRKINETRLTNSSTFGVIYVIVNSKKDKGKALKEHILKDIVPRGFVAEIEGIQEKHRQAIEEKDATTALLSDNLQNREHENVALQAQRDVYKD